MKKKALTSKKRPKLIVPQALLEQYGELCQLAHRKKHLRQTILDLLNAGATVEPGDISVRIDVNEQKRITWAKLADIVGEDRATAIRMEVAPSETYRLQVGRQP